MIIIAYIILVFTLIQFLVALVNLVSECKLPDSGFRNGPLVSVLIPSRDEENNIGHLLDDISGQGYPDYEVLVFDDDSKDRTAAIVSEFSSRNPRIRLVTSEGLPEGWIGKNHACHSLSEYAKGEYFLFLDADVRISGNLIGDAVAFAKKYGTGLVSIFPEQIIRSFGERITVPNMNYILVSLLPLILVRKSPFPSLAAANGQFMLFESATYKRFLPHDRMKNNKVEDISIARYFKKNRIKIACLLGDKRIRCRMYQGYSEAVNGFSKNVLSFFGNSLIAAVSFWLITSFGFIAVLESFSITVFFLYVLLYFTTRILVSVTSLQNAFNNSIYVLPLQISLGNFIVKAFINRYFRNYVWKGRNIK